MANKYVDFGVTNGIGTMDGSDVNNYMGWSQFFADNHSGVTYLARGMKMLSAAVA